MPLSSLLTQYIARRPQRIELLRHIAEQGSITRAAKSAGLSYKAAWDAIDELNNLAGQALVVRAVGGKGGGGAVLSEEGARVLRLYQKLQALQAQILQAAEDINDFDLLGRLMMRTSARNQLHGRVAGIDARGGSDLITLDLGAGLHLRAQITHESTLALELQPGRAVVALIKAGWLDLHPGDVTPAPGINALVGQVDQVLQAADGSGEVRIALGNGQTLCAQSPGAGYAAGQQVCVHFSPTLVLLGTTL